MRTVLEDNEAGVDGKWGAIGIFYFHCGGMATEAGSGFVQMHFMACTQQMRRCHTSNATADNRDLHGTTPAEDPGAPRRRRGTMRVYHSAGNNVAKRRHRLSCQGNRITRAPDHKRWNR